MLELKFCTRSITCSSETLQESARDEFYDNLSIYDHFSSKTICLSDHSKTSFYENIIHTLTNPSIDMQQRVTRHIIAEVL